MLWRTGQPAKRPGTIEPCIPTRVSNPPVGPQWIHEIKHDGYRLIARKRDGRARLFSRLGFDWTDRYPLIHSAVAALRGARAKTGNAGNRISVRGLAVEDEVGAIDA